MAEFLYTGRRGAGASPDSACELYYVVQEFIYSGRRAAAILPDSETLVSSVFTYVGQRAAAILPNTPSALSEMVYSGSIEHGWVPDFVGLEATFAYAGSIALAVTPGAGYGAERSYVGSIEVVLTPESAAVVDAVYEALITLSLTPSVGTAALEKVYEGSILCTLRPISDYEGSGVTIHEYAGNIPVSLLPQVAEAVCDAVYSGSLSLTLTPTGVYLPSTGVFEYNGQMTIAFSFTSFYVIQGPLGPRPKYAHPRPRKNIVDIHRRA